MAEILPGNTVVRFAIIGSDARSSADKLVNQTIVDRIERDFPGKSDDGFSKTRRALAKVVKMTRRFVAQFAGITVCCQSPESQFVYSRFAFKLGLDGAVHSSFGDSDFGLIPS